MKAVTLTNITTSDPPTFRDYTIYQKYEENGQSKMSSLLR